MTTDSLPAILNATLAPLVSIIKQVEAALELAQRMKLPGAFIYTIKDSATALDGIHDTLLDISVALDPQPPKDQL